MLFSIYCTRYVHTHSLTFIALYSFNKALISNVEVQSYCMMGKKHFLISCIIYLLCKNH